MRMLRAASVFAAVSTLAVAVLSGVPAQGSHGSAAVCDLLNRQQVLASISGAGEMALRNRCGLVSNGAPQGSATAPAAPDFGADVLVNDRATDTWTHITQSETTVASGNGVILAGYNDSHEFPANATGYSRSTNAGATWTDMGRPTTPLGVVDAGVR